MQVINWELVSHPLNWLTLFLMVFIAVMFVSLVMTAFGWTPPPQPGNNTTPLVNSASM